MEMVRKHGGSRVPPNLPDSRHVIVVHNLKKNSLPGSAFVFRLCYYRLVVGNNETVVDNK